MRPLKIAVIGAGPRGRSHMAALRRMEDTEIVAVCDPSEEARNAAISDFGVQTGYDSVAALLDGQEMDAVFLATPAHLNARVALPCLKRGVDTLLEKPPGMSAAETRELRDAAAASGARGMVAWNRRFHPIVARAMELVAERGPVVQLVGEFHKSMSGFLKTRRFPEIVMDNMLLETPIHSIDLVRALAGSDVAQVHSVVRRAFSPYKDVHGALVEFENGCIAHIIANYTTDARLERYEIHGRDISAYLEGIKTGYVVCDGKTIDLGEPLSGGLDEEVRYFLDCVRAKKPVSLPAANLDEAVKTMELADAILAGVRG